jgi:hypothetical protein
MSYPTGGTRHVGSKSQGYPSIADVANDPASAANIAANQAAFEQSQADAAAAGGPPCDTSPEGIRSRGGYLLMDPQWVAGGPWNGIPAEEMQGEANRRADIVEQMKTGTAFGYTESGATNPSDDLDAFATDLAGFFPASQAGRANLEARTDQAARIDFSVEVGNGLAACTMDPGFWVASIADAT